MKFGLAFQASQTDEHYLKCLRLAAKYGFDQFQVYDDLLYRPAWSVLDRLAPHVRGSKADLTIGPGVTNPFHYHPAVIAALIEDLDQATGGRAVLMIGRGAFHDIVGIKVENPMEAVREAVEIVYNLTRGIRSAVDGKKFSLKAEAHFRWNLPEGYRQKDRAGIPIWIGTWGPKMCELAGSMPEVSGVMVSSIVDPGYIRSLKVHLDKGANMASRDPASVGLGLVSGTVVSKDRDLALKLARESVAPYMPYLAPMTDFMGIDREEIRAIREALADGNAELAASLVSDRSVNAFKPWGTPDDIIETVSKLDGTGLSRMNFGFGRGDSDLEGIELIGRKVLPYFREKET